MLIQLREPESFVLATDRGNGLTRREAATFGAGDDEAAFAQRAVLSFNACEPLTIARLSSLASPSAQVNLREALAILDHFVKHNPGAVARLLDHVRKP